jgi:ferredoxin-NADP reductase
LGRLSRLDGESDDRLPDELVDEQIDDDARTLDELPPDGADDPVAPRFLPWLTATLVDRRAETATASTLALDAPGWTGALAGQHVDVRLTADDGYSAERSYSLASPAGAGVELTVQVVEDGEVSSYLTTDMEPGDQLEVRGPIGRWFVWRPTSTRPVQLIGGGSGLVPLMSMVRTREAAGSTTPFRLLVSARTPDDAIYDDELAALDDVEVTRVWTRRAPAGWTGRVGRLDAATLAAACFAPDAEPDVFVCGPTPFVEAVANALVDLGHMAGRIRTERFGPTGT